MLWNWRLQHGGGGGARPTPKPWPILCALVVLALPSLAGAELPSGPSPGEIRLSSSEKAADLHVAMTVPEGWSVQWYTAQRGPTLARVFRTESKGAEAVVVAATKMKTEDARKSAAALFDERFVREMGDSLRARRQQRVRNDFWDGAYFQYDINLSTGESVGKAEVRNWMMAADGYLVQFQCYFLKNFDLEAEERTGKEDALAQVYRDILLSVRVVPPEERPAPAPASKAQAKQPARRP